MRSRSVLLRWWAPGDILIVLGVIALSVFLILEGAAGAGDGTELTVSITVNGEEYLTLPLTRELEEITVEGYRGESYVEIDDGKVRMVDSACPDKLCVRSGWISRPGESIVCLPNRVVIEIKSGEGGPDAVNR
jgi:hypothetical protein